MELLRPIWHTSGMEMADGAFPMIESCTLPSSPLEDSIRARDDMLNEANPAFTLTVTSAIGIMFAFMAAYLEECVEPIGVNAPESDRRRGSRWVENCLADPAQLCNQCFSHS